MNSYAAEIVGWIPWSAKQPTHHQCIFFKTESKIQAGMVIDRVKVYSPENLNMPLVPLFWQPIPLPEDNEWLRWYKHEPSAGTYIWIRDPASPDDYELAWAVGGPGDISAVLPLDDTLSQIKEDQWQPVKVPSKQ